MKAPFRGSTFWIRLQVVGTLCAVASATVLGVALASPDVLLDRSSKLPDPAVIPTSPPDPGQADPRSFLTLRVATSTAASDEPQLPGNLPSYLRPTEQSVPPVSDTSGTPRQTPTSAAGASACVIDCILLGVATEEFPGDWSALDSFNALSHGGLDIVAFFQAWGDHDREFKTWLPQLDEKGYAPLITWEPWTRKEGNTQGDITLQSIVDGQHDPYIDEWAAQAAAYGSPLYLRFAHEMNTPAGTVYWYPWQGDPHLYARTWRYVHDRFTTAGASNVQWVWSPAWVNDDAVLYYPGPDYVDWVAVTVLNFGTEGTEPVWRSFEQLYNPQHAHAVSYGKPVMLSEVASAERGGDKGTWIAGIGPSLQYNFPEIRSVVWMNYSQARYISSVNWRVDSSQEAIAGWLEFVTFPYVHQ